MPTTTTRTTIAIDMDEVMADVMPKFLDFYEARYGHRPEREAYWGKKLYDLPGVESLRDVLHEPGFFRDLPIMPHAQEVVAELNERFDILIVTAAMEFRHSFVDKYDWLREHFPFLNWKDFVFCGRKDFVRADYLIDDHLRNLKAFSGTGLLFTASHNVHDTTFERVNDWLEVRAYFATVENEEQA